MTSRTASSGPLPTTTTLSRPTTRLSPRPNPTHADLRCDERLSASAVSREAAPGLNSVAHMWLGSDFCARHILKALPDLPELPSFWTREQRGEEASAWLIFDHKYPYLRETTKALGGRATTSAFCLPE